LHYFPKARQKNKLKLKIIPPFGRKAGSTSLGRAPLSRNMATDRWWSEVAKSSGSAVVVCGNSSGQDAANLCAHQPLRPPSARNTDFLRGRCRIRA
jgi:hypothetical protein